MIWSLVSLYDQLTKQWIIIIIIIIINTLLSWEFCIFPWLSTQLAGNTQYVPDSHPYHLIITSSSGSWSYKLTKLQISGIKTKHRVYCGTQNTHWSLITGLENCVLFLHASTVENTLVSISTGPKILRYFCMHPRLRTHWSLQSQDQRYWGIFVCIHSWLHTGPATKALLNN